MGRPARTVRCPTSRSNPLHLRGRLASGRLSSGPRGGDPRRSGSADRHDDVTPDRNAAEVLAWLGERR